VLYEADKQRTWQRYKRGSALSVRQLPGQARRHGSRLRDSQPIAVPAVNGHHERLLSDAPDHRDVVGIATLPGRDPIEAEPQPVNTKKRGACDVVRGPPR